MESCPYLKFSVDNSPFLPVPDHGHSADYFEVFRLEDGDGLHDAGDVGCAAFVSEGESGQI